MITDWFPQDGKVSVATTHFLGPGWFLKRPIDLSDPQWKTIREYFVIGSIGFVTWGLMSRTIRKIIASYYPAVIICYTE